GLPTVGGRGLPTVGATGPAWPADRPDDGPTSSWDGVRADLATLRRGGPTGEIALAADTLDRLVRSALGVEPDAAYGRLTLRPAFPTHWNAFEASGLALADARLGFTWDRTGALHRFRLRQTAGGAPITWILEPWLFGSGLTSARVDGEPAELDAVPDGGGVRPRIQLPAERERVVELEVSPP
ncbi:MAG: hypothetical protein HKO98_00660, partial [Gemmatimonadetes bacterium]|nr:hypothetical protein [Gemmatimonadota bacterium]